MELKDLQTPCWLVDQHRLQENIEEFQRVAEKHKKQLWPMIKTHKCSTIARLQKAAGAQGFRGRNPPGMPGVAGTRAWASDVCLSGGRRT